MLSHLYVLKLVIIFFIEIPSTLEEEEGDDAITKNDLLSDEWNKKDLSNSPKKEVQIKDDHTQPLCVNAGLLDIIGDLSGKL